MRINRWLLKLLVFTTILISTLSICMVTYATSSTKVSVDEILKQSYRNNVKVAFEDKNFENVIRQAVNKPTGDIYSSDLTNVTEIITKGANIKSIKGIKYCKNLKVLDLHSNNIIDISELKSLSALEEINLENNNVKDLRPLSSLNNLTVLLLGNNQISSMDSLSNLKKLNNLNLRRNRITTVNGRNGFNSLSFLSLEKNNIRSFNPAGGFKNLKALLLLGDNISNYQGFKSLRNLETLKLDGYNITDMSAFKQIPKLRELQAMGYGNANPVDSAKFEALIKKADEVLSQIIKPGMDQLQKERAIHDYILSHTEYDSDGQAFNEGDTSKKGSDNFMSSYGVLIGGKAVCSGYAAASSFLLNRSGIEAMSVSGTIIPSGEHVWNIVKINGNYYQYDATWDDANSDAPYEYFNVSDDKMSQTRTWIRDEYPKCNISLPMIFPKVTGVEDMAVYNTDRAISYEKGTATLDGTSFLNGSTVSKEGTYVLVARNSEGNTTTINFTIDKTPPVVAVNPNGGSVIAGTSVGITVKDLTNVTTKYRWDTDEYSIASNDKNFKVIVPSTSGQRILYIYSWDSASNATTINPLTFNIEAIAIPVPVQVAPVATKIYVSSATTSKGLVNLLAASYAYRDADGDAEGASIYRWLRSDTATGIYTAIEGATGRSYTVTKADYGKYIKFEVTPVSMTGTPNTGAAVQSEAIAIPAPAQSAPVASKVYLFNATASTGMINLLYISYTYSDADGDVEGASIYRWLRADTATGTYAAIEGATGRSYTVTKADYGKYIKFEVTPVSATGTPSIGVAVQSEVIAIPAK